MDDGEYMQPFIRARPLIYTPLTLFAFGFVLVDSKYGADGKEDVEFRLLHVYFSAKRAINKGFSVSKAGGAVSDGSYSPPVSKRARRTPRNKPSLMTPKTTMIHRGVNASTAHLSTSPAITTSTAGSNSSCNSTASMESPMHPGFRFKAPTHRGADDMETEPPMPPMNSHNLIGFEDIECDDTLNMCNFHSVGSSEFPQVGSFGYSLPPSVTHGFPSMTGIYSGPLPMRQPSYPLMHHSHRTLDTIYWNDPLLPMSMNFDLDAASGAPDESLDVATFANHLESVHRQICDKIQASPSGDQGALLEIFTSWATHVAKEPMTHSFDNQSIAPSEPKEE
jgi:hypothetical protein